jgi:hypothetical protein
MHLELYDIINKTGDFYFHGNFLVNENITPQL